MARRGDGIYQRGPSWYLDCYIHGVRHVHHLGRGISRTVAQELAQAKRVAILRAAAGLGPPVPRRMPRRRPTVVWGAGDGAAEALAPLRARLGEPVVSLPAGALLLQPLVYAWISATGVVRYVGMSRRGLARPLNPQHHKAQQIESTDRLIVWPVATPEAAEQAERNILTALGPSLNAQRPHASLHVVRPEGV
jgi:hypothetical protein